MRYHLYFLNKTREFKVALRILQLSQCHDSLETRKNTYLKSMESIFFSFSYVAFSSSSCQCRKYSLSVTGDDTTFPLLFCPCLGFPLFPGGRIKYFFRMIPQIFMSESFWCVIVQHSCWLICVLAECNSKWKTKFRSSLQDPEFQVTGAIFSSLVSKLAQHVENKTCSMTVQTE